MGQVATNLANITIFTAEDPRNEDVNEIINQMASKIKNAKEIGLKKAVKQKTFSKNILPKKENTGVGISPGCSCILE